MFDTVRCQLSSLPYMCSHVRLQLSTDTVRREYLQAYSCTSEAAESNCRDCLSKGFDSLFRFFPTQQRPLTPIQHLDPNLEYESIQNEITELINSSGENRNSAISKVLPFLRQARTELVQFLQKNPCDEYGITSLSNKRFGETQMRSFK